MIWNIYELSALQLSRVTAIFVVDCCQFGLNWIFGLKMELMACAGLVGGTTEQSCIFPDLKFYYQWYEILPNCLHYISAVPQTFLVVDCCQFGPSWIFGLKMELMARAGLVVGTTEQICLFLTWNVSINDMKHSIIVCITP